MTLTYRVQNCNQQNMAGASNKPALTYRVPRRFLQQVIRLNQNQIPCLLRGLRFGSRYAQNN